MLLKKIANAQVIKTIQQRAFHRSIVSLGHAAAVKHDEHKADGHHDEHHHHEHYTDNDGEAFGIHVWKIIFIYMCFRRANNTSERDGNYPFLQFLLVVWVC